jgi:thymidylate kinase
MATNNMYCFFGVDGAGKTTTIEGIKKMFEDSGESVVIHNMNRAGNNKLFFIQWAMKLKSFIFRTLKVKPKGTDGESVVLVDIYRERSLLFLIIYYIDLWLRFNEAKRLSKNNIVLMDRYFYDGLVLGHQRWFKLFCKFTPKIKSFFLYASPEVILERKQEASKDNIIDYTDKVKTKFVDKFDITMIDTSEELKEVLNKIFYEIHNKKSS